MPTGPDIFGRVAILGAGREGAAAFDHITGLPGVQSVTVIAESLSDSETESRLNDLGVLMVCPFDEADLAGYDVLVRSPGISRYRPSLQQAREAGVRITTPSNIWFNRHAAANTIVITGTKGKSTTAALLAHLLRGLGLRTRLAGNIGTPLLACDDRDVDWWVIELSSYQLADLEAEPTFGVLLNLATDHLDWHGSEARYHADKLRLADLVKPGHLIANRRDGNLREALAAYPSTHWFDVETSPAARAKMPASLPGIHNRANLAACLAVLEQLGFDAGQAIRETEGFESLPHRLCHVGRFEGVDYIDDSISTAPVATIAALEAFRDRQVVLLVGGFERGIDWAPYADSIRDLVPLAVIGMPDNGPAIIDALEKGGIEPELGYVESENLPRALAAARQLAPAGGVVLLSPGAPSFPYFRDFADRGRQFASLCSRFD